jgi:cbb3-type cytochrome oxidase subunit 3
MDIGTVHGIWTLLMIVVFVAIVVWAWSGRRKQYFEQAARIPLDDDDAPESSTLSSKENPHG